MTLSFITENSTTLPFTLTLENDQKKPVENAVVNLTVLNLSTGYELDWIDLVFKKEDWGKKSLPVSHIENGIYQHVISLADVFGADPGDVLIANFAVSSPFQATASDVIAVVKSGTDLKKVEPLIS